MCKQNIMKIGENSVYNKKCTQVIITVGQQGFSFHFCALVLYIAITPLSRYVTQMRLTEYQKTIQYDNHI